MELGEDWACCFEEQQGGQHGYSRVSRREEKKERSEEELELDPGGTSTSFNVNK